MTLLRTFSSPEYVGFIFLFLLLSLRIGAKFLPRTLTLFVLTTYELPRNATAT